MDKLDGFCLQVVDQAVEEVLQRLSKDASHRMVREIAQRGVNPVLHIVGNLVDNRSHFVHHPVGDVVPDGVEEEGFDVEVIARGETLEKPCDKGAHQVPQGGVAAHIQIGPTGVEETGDGV